MGKFKSAAKAFGSFIGDVVEATAERNKKIDDITDQLMRHKRYSYHNDVDYSAVREVAAILADHTEEIIWK